MYASKLISVLFTNIYFSYF